MFDWRKTHGKQVARVITLVEDEPAILENYSDAFSREGYDVKAFLDGTSALNWCRTRIPDLAVLDIRLGENAEAGFDLCRELRALSASLPIIFLTARDSDVDVVSGFRVGADDYVSKDTSLPHLLARIAALFRRVDALREPDKPAEILDRGLLRLDLDRMQTTWNGKILELTVTEYWILHSLARYPGHVKTRDQLMQEANVLVDDATITSHIKRVRRKFETIDPNFDGIETVYGLGYRWTGA